LLAYFDIKIYDFDKELLTKDFDDLIAIYPNNTNLKALRKYYLTTILESMKK
jgi:hypothetical protein